VLNTYATRHTLRCHLRQDPQTLHEYHGCATQLVAGGFEVLCTADDCEEDPTTESTQVLKLGNEQCLRSLPYVNRDPC
jgi:hypothetical protein